MDVSEERYRRVMSEVRGRVGDLLLSTQGQCEDLPKLRSVGMLLRQGALTQGHSPGHTLYSQCLSEVREDLIQTAVETRVQALRLSLSLPIALRFKLLLENQKELGDLLLRPDNAFLFQRAADGFQFLLSLFQLSSANWESSLDANTRIVSLVSRLLLLLLEGDREGFPVGCEALRLLMLRLPQGQPRVKVLTRISATLPRGKRRLALLLRVREYELRQRPKLLVGHCALAAEEPDLQNVEWAFREVLIAADNLSESEVTLEVFLCLKQLNRNTLPYDFRLRLLLRWLRLLKRVTFKKEFMEVYAEVSSQLQEAPCSLRFQTGVFCLEVSKQALEQSGRLGLLLQGATHLVGVARAAYLLRPQTSLFIELFQFKWFVNRIKLEGDQFRSELALTLLHCFLSLSSIPQPQEYSDILALTHRLIDWKLAKEEPLLSAQKLAFDLYLALLKLGVKGALRASLDHRLPELVERCNDESMQSLLRLQLSATLLSIPDFNPGINFDFLQGQIRPFMMPLQPKPIFDLEYSLTADGQIESRREIETIRRVMYLLSLHPAAGQSLQLQADYHQYLTDLESTPNANRDLIHCLRTLQADEYFSQSQRSFLLALTGSPTLGFDGTPLSSPFESFATEQLTLFGTASPVQLNVTFLPSPSFSAVRLQLRQHCAVPSPPLRLTIASKVEVRHLLLEETVIDIRIDRLGALHFQLWTDQGTSYLLGSQNIRVKRLLKWLRCDHLSFIEGNRTRAYFKQETPPRQTFLSSFFGEPLLLHLCRAQQEVVVTLPNKEMWADFRLLLSDYVDQLVEGSAVVLDSLSNLQ